MITLAKARKWVKIDPMRLDDTVVKYADRLRRVGDQVAMLKSQRDELSDVLKRTEASAYAALVEAGSPAHVCKASTAVDAEVVICTRELRTKEAELAEWQNLYVSLDKQSTMIRLLADKESREHFATGSVSESRKQRVRRAKRES